MVIDSGDFLKTFLSRACEQGGNQFCSSFLVNKRERTDVINVVQNKKVPQLKLQHFFVSIYNYICST